MPTYCESTQSCPTFCDHMDYTVHGILQTRILEWVAFPFSRGSSQSRHRTQVSRIAGRFFTSWATREAQEYWSGKPIPSPGIFLTQESNWGLLHCRWILYQLSYQGSPCVCVCVCVYEQMVFICNLVSKQVKFEIFELHCLIYCKCCCC